MNAENFIDSNILVYLFDEINLDKYRRADALVWDNLDNGTGCISYQVIQESLNVVGRMIGVGSDRLIQFLEQILLPLWEVNRIIPTPDLYRNGLRIQARYGFSFYDSLIVAAALGAGCTTLYSEDMQNGQRIQGLTIRNPFAETRTT